MVAFKEFNKGKGVQPRESRLATAGWYSVEITKSDLAKSKAGHAMIKLVFSIIGRVLGPGETTLDGDPEEFAGQAIFTNLNIQNEKDDVVNRAFRDLEAIGAACGLVEEFDDTSQLHRIPILAKISVRAADANYPESNSIGSFRKLPVEGAAPAWSAPAATSQIAPIDFGAFETPATAAQTAPTTAVDDADDEERAAIEETPPPPAAASAPARVPAPCPDPPGFTWDGIGQFVPVAASAPAAEPKRRGRPAKEAAPAVATPQTAAPATAASDAAPWE